MLGARRRGPLGLVALLLAGVAALFAGSPAMAGVQGPPSIASDPNPMSTNIPMLGWRGENIRLVKCSDDLSPGEINVLRNLGTQRGDYIVFADASFDFLLEEWGGGTRDPQAIGSSSGWFIAGDKLCVRETWTSAGAGLARIKLAVNVDTTHLVLGSPRALLLNILQRSSLLQHQFLAGWLAMGDPVVTELPLGGDGPNSEGNPLGSGVLNTFWADGVLQYDRRNQGVLQATVTGALPVGGDFAGVFPSGSLTLPADWPTMAAKLATDANVNNTNPAHRWDIHDQSDLGSFTTEGHPTDPTNSTCAPSTRPVNLPGGILDAVDNCDGGYAFSRVFDADGPGGLAPIGIPSLGLTNNNTRGPFDPQREQETFLGDGQLTADDAPMPAARIDFTIKANAHDDKDIGGVGSFAKTNKNDLYSADRPLNANAGSGSDTEHNLYAPYYRAYVPATGAPNAEASGTDGLPGNNFSGYLVGDGVGGEGDRSDDDRMYDYWDIAHEFVARTLNGYDTKCLWRERSYNDPVFRQTPEGPQKVAIYTDEHGIGSVNFRPGSGFWFNALIAANPNLGDNLNGGCDLKYLADNLLGHADITAAAYYPNQPVSGSPAGSASIRKTVKSLFAKYLAVFPKGNSPELRNARIVVAHAQDIDGSPFANETVCFSKTSASGVVHAFVPSDSNNLAKVVGGYNLVGSVRVDDPVNSQDSDRVCVRTNQYGNAAIEVLESQGAEINVIGDFVDERILRDVKIPFGEATPTTNDPGIPPRAPGAQGQPQGPPPVNAAGNTSPSAATLAALAQGNVQVSSSRKLKSARVSVRFARVVNSAKGTRYLSLRLKGTKRSAAVRIQLMGYDGKVIRTLRRTVKVGSTVRLRNVRLGANVRNVRVSVVN